MLGFMGEMAGAFKSAKFMAHYQKLYPEDFQMAIFLDRAIRSKTRDTAWVSPEQSGDTMIFFGIVKDPFGDVRVLGRVSPEQKVAQVNFLPEPFGSSMLHLTKAFVSDGYLQQAIEFISRVNGSYPLGCLKLHGTAEHPMSKKTSLVFVQSNGLNYEGSPLKAAGELARNMIDHCAQTVKIVQPCLIELGDSGSVGQALAKAKWPSRRPSRNVAQLQRAVARFLEEMNIRHEPGENTQEWWLTSRKSVWAQLLYVSNDGRVVFKVQRNEPVPEDRRLDVARYMAFVNENFSQTGFFMMNHDSGRSSYHTFLDALGKEEHVSTPLLNNMYRENAQSARKFIAGLDRVVQGLEPDVAVNEVNFL